MSDRPTYRVTWYKDSPDAGDPACLCSLCGKPIPEGQVPYRMINRATNEEARFDMECGQGLVDAAIVVDEPFQPRVTGIRFKIGDQEYPPLTLP